MLINNLLEASIAELQLLGKTGTITAYQSAVNSVLAVLKDEASISHLYSVEGLGLYEKRLYASGLCNNTVSFYMRMLRAMYNKGVALGLCPESPHLFDNVYTGIDSTPKRAIPPDIFGQLKKLDLFGRTNLEFACDLFLLSYSLQGISFVDLAHLRKSDLKDSMLSYHRAKTGSWITVAVSPFSKKILEKYAPATIDCPYLLPIITNPDGDTSLQYKSALRTYNRRLKKLAELAGIEYNLSSYVARHSWATVARNENVPIGLISQAMGHKTEEITQIYLARYDHNALFLANEKILIAANLIEDERVNNKSKRNTLQVVERNVRHLRSERHKSSANI